MGKAENDLKKKIMLDFSNDGFVLFRNNSGQYEIAEKGKIRVIKYGVGNTANFSGSDIVGWHKVEHRVPDGRHKYFSAEIVGIEVKTLAYPNLTKKQANFLRIMRTDGGFAAVVRENKKCEKGYKVITLTELDEEIRDAMLT